MTFYKIRPDAERVGGREVYPSWEYDTNQPNSETQLKYTALPDVEPIFSNVYVNKLSDVMLCGNIGGEGFIVSEKLKKLLTSHHIDTHRFYPLNVFWYETKKQVTDNFYWFQIVSTNFTDWIDFQRSSFCLFDDFQEKQVKSLDLKNSEQLINTIMQSENTDNIVIYDKLIFNANFKQFDLFYMDNLFDNLFNYPIVSQTLKHALEKNKIAAFEFKEVNIFAKS